MLSLDNACYIPERLRDVSCRGAIQINITFTSSVSCTQIADDDDDDEDDMVMSSLLFSVRDGQIYVRRYFPSKS